MEKISCDLCGHEIIASLTKPNTEFFRIDPSGALKESIPGHKNNPDSLNTQSISFQCSNPDCGQVIGDLESFQFYVSNSEPDEFRLFKQLDILQDVIEELCRIQLHTKSLNASVVIRNTLKGLPGKLPMIIDMKRKMVEGDFVDQVDLKDVFK